MKKYKIAYIGLKGLPAISGADRVVENIIECLDKNRFNVTFYGIKGYANKHYNSKGYRQIVFPRIPIKNFDMFFHFLLSALHALTKKYDLIHLHNIDSAFTLLLLNLKYRNRLIATSHGNPQDRDKWGKFAKKYFGIMTKIFIKKSHIITSVAIPYCDKYKKITKKEIIYIPNGVNINEKIDKEEAYKRLRKYNVSEGFLLFASGRIIPTKGCDIFLEALELMNYKDAVVIAGDISQTKEYEEKIKRLIMKTKTNYIGFINSKPELLGLISLAKYFVFPSTVEAMSMMLLEVASVKTPIICSDIPENTVVFNNDEVLFFKSGDVQDLAEKLKWAISNPDEMKKKSLRAYNKVKDKYLWSNITKQYEKLYQQILR